MGDTARDGVEVIADLLVHAGADIELDQGPHGTPLFNACAFKTADVMKYLVRASALIMSRKG